MSEARESPGLAASGDPSSRRSSVLRSWLVALAPGLAGALLLLGGQARPEFVEALYAREWYPRIADLIARAGVGWGAVFDGDDLSRRHVSASEALILVLVVVVVWRLVAALRRGPGDVLRLGVRLAGSAYACFVLAWGLNHARLPLAHALELEVRPVPDTVLYEVAMSIHADLVEILDAEESRAASFDRASAGREAVALWREAVAREPRLGQRHSLAIVSPAASSLLVSSRIAGIFSPFTQEAHVAFGMPLDDLLFTACHELAHAQGWAREDEANYLAWRVASRSGRPAFERAAHLIALRHVHGAAARESRSMGMLIAIGLDPRVAELLGQRAAFWESSSSPTASRAASRVNDAYLKSQGQAGVVSYGRMVDLLVAERLDASASR